MTARDGARPADPRRRRHPGPPGAARAAAPAPRVVVVGAGIAGLTAATALAERGVTVQLFEREPQVGGRVGGWTTGLPDGTRTGMSRGFHAFFRQYYNLRALLARTDPELSGLRPVPDYPLVDARGRRDTFRGIPRTPPWNALAFALRSPTFGPRALRRLAPGAAAPLADVRVPDIYRRLDDLDAHTFLDRIRFPDTARHLAFDVFSRSFFARPEALSAAELAVMFHLYFLGSAEGLLFDVPERPFDRLWDPLVERLDRHGATVHTGTPVHAVAPPEAPGAPFRVSTACRTVPADAVVLALDVGGLRELVAASPALGGSAWRDRVAAQPSAPAFCVRRLWLDRPVDATRPAFLATGGRPPLDNISVLDRYDADARHRAARHGGSVVELHAYAVGDAPPAAVRAATERELPARLHELYPETADAGIVADRVVWHADCPLFPPGGFPRRVTVDTPVDGLVLAGDGVRVDLPVALMERAATTGFVAANRLLSRWGVAGHDVVTVPTRGRGPVLRALAARAPAAPGDPTRAGAARA